MTKNKHILLTLRKQGASTAFCSTCWHQKQFQVFISFKEIFASSRVIDATDLSRESVGSLGRAVGGARAPGCSSPPSAQAPTQTESSGLFPGDGPLSLTGRFRPPPHSHVAALSPRVALLGDEASREVTKVKEVSRVRS